jgi:hypothetical protein
MEPNGGLIISISPSLKFGLLEAVTWYINVFDVDVSEQTYLIENLSPMLSPMSRREKPPSKGFVHKSL